jgi:hypothetical protein
MLALPHSLGGVPLLARWSEPVLGWLADHQNLLVNGYVSLLQRSLWWSRLLLSHLVFHYVELWIVNSYSALGNISLTPLCNVHLSEHVELLQLHDVLALNMVFLKSSYEKRLALNSLAIGPVNVRDWCLGH